MSNTELIENFYIAFSEGNSQGMVECYHDNIIFQDPVFGTLKGERAKDMWRMLLSQKKAETTITFDHVNATDNAGKANWVAMYLYGPKKRKVVNKVQANFKFQDGKIIEHIDTFDLWKWTKQAMGPIGYLMGWTSIIRNKILKTTNKNLDKFIAKK